MQNVYNAVAGATLGEAVLQGHDVQLGTDEFKIGLTMTTMDAINTTNIKTSEMSARPVTLETNASCDSISVRVSLPKSK